MNRTPLVSVEMNVRNGERHLEEAIQSILEQSYKHFEFIIINDGLTDRTHEILARLPATDHRLHVHHQEKLGIYYSANNGCRSAKGKYLARFDADDISFPERVERQVAFLEAHPNIAVLARAVIRIDEDGIPYITYTLPAEPSQVNAAISSWDAIVQPTVMIRKDNFLKANGYREIYELAEDWDLGPVEKSRQRRSRHFSVLTYRRYVPRAKKGCGLAGRTVLKTPMLLATQAILSKFAFGVWYYSTLPFMDPKVRAI